MKQVLTVIILVLGFLTFTEVAPSVFAQGDVPIPIIASEGDVVVFPYFLKDISSLRTENITPGDPIETRPQFEKKTLDQLKVFIDLLPHTARDSNGRQLSEDQVNSKTIFPTTELQQIYQIYMEEIKDQDLDALFQAAYYLEIPSLQNAFAYFIALRIYEDMYDNGNLEQALLKKEFILSYSVVCDEQDQSTRRCFEKHLGMFGRNLSENSVGDYIATYGQPEIIDGKLDLSNKKLTSLQGLHHVHNLGEVGEISLSGNCISELNSGEGQTLRLCTKLKQLHLDKNELTSIPREFLKNLARSKVTVLNFSNNRIEGLPENLFQMMGQLESLDLSKNQIRSLPVGLIRPLSSLRSLDVSGNLIKNIHFEDLKGLKDLEVLRLGDNKIDSLQQNAFFGLNNLKELYLQGNLLNNLPLDLFLYQGLSNLRVLDLSSNQITQLPEGSFLGIRALERLDLHNNQLTQFSPESFKGLVNLHMIDYSGNVIQSDVHDDLLSQIQRFNQEHSPYGLGLAPRKTKG